MLSRGRCISIQKCSLKSRLRYEQRTFVKDIWWCGLPKTIPLPLPDFERGIRGSVSPRKHTSMSHTTDGSKCNTVRYKCSAEKTVAITPSYNKNTIPFPQLFRAKGRPIYSKQFDFHQVSIEFSNFFHSIHRCCPTSTVAAANQRHSSGTPIYCYNYWRSHLSRATLLSSTTRSPDHLQTCRSSHSWPVHQRFIP